MGIDTGVTASWASADRPVGGPTGVSTGDAPPKDAPEGWTDDHDDRSGLPCAGRRDRGLRRADRPAPPRAPGPLLPDARLGPGCRGRPPGDAAGGLAGDLGVRGSCLGADVALPDRHEPVSQRASLSRSTPGQGVGRGRSATARTDTARRGGLAPAVAGHPHRRPLRPGARPGGPRRAVGVDLAGLRDGAAAAPAAPARRPRPARRAGLPGGEVAEMLDSTRRVGHQRPQASASRRGPASVGRRRPRTGARVRLSRPRRHWSRRSSGPTRPATSTPSSPCSPTTCSCRCRRCPTSTRAARPPCASAT